MNVHYASLLAMTNSNMSTNEVRTFQFRKCRKGLCAKRCKHCDNDTLTKTTKQFQHVPVQTVSKYTNLMYKQLSNPNIILYTSATKLFRHFHVQVFQLLYAHMISTNYIQLHNKNQISDSPLTTIHLITNISRPTLHSVKTLKSIE